ncbi:thiosulfate reductase PhsA [Slackia heliotrinireducens]|nr:thiosulfate reductase PhsA [Slackia heliotrinireducens]
MKRKNWSPDAPNGELRGVDEWERISWDEAFQTIADQLKNTIDKYGNRSILYAGTATAFGQIANCINGVGGGLASSSTESFGSCQMYSDPVIARRSTASASPTTAWTS